MAILEGIPIAVSRTLRVRLGNSNEIYKRVHEFVSKQNLIEQKSQNLINAIIGARSFAVFVDVAETDKIEFIEERKAAKTFIKSGEAFIKAINKWQNNSKDTDCLITKVTAQLDNARRILEVKYPQSRGRGQPIDLKMQTLVSSLASAYLEAFELMPTISKNDSIEGKHGRFYNFFEGARKALRISQKISGTTISNYIKIWKNQNKALLATITMPKRTGKK